MAAAGFTEARKKVTRSQVVIGVTEAIRFAMLLVLTAALGRALAPADFGFVTLVPSIYLVVHVVLDLGTGALIARETARRPDRERPLLEAALAVRAVAGGAAGLVVAAFALADPDPARRLWLYVTAASLPALAPSVIGAAFRVRQDQFAPAVISIGTILLMNAATFLCVSAHAPGPTFAVVYVLREVVGGGSLWIVARVRHGIVLAPGLRGRGAAAFFRAAVPQNVAVVFQVASLNVGVFGVRALLSDDDLGAYSAAWRLVNPLLMLMGALVAPLLPVLAQTSRDRAAFSRILAPAIGLGAAIGVLGIGFLVAAGRDALRLIYGSAESAKFSAGTLDAGPALLWLGFVFGAVCVGAVCTTALLCLDGERELRRLAIMALLVNVLTFGLTMPALGRVAAAAGLLAAEALTAAGALALLVRRVGAPQASTMLRSLAPAAAVAILMQVVSFGAGPLVRVAIASALALSGLAFVFLTGPGVALRRALHEPLA